jgi:hypothetical protein
VPPGVPTSYRALADRGNVPHATLHHRACGRRSIEQKAQSQQYLTPWEEDVVVKFSLQMSEVSQSLHKLRIQPLRKLSFRSSEFLVFALHANIIGNQLRDPVVV